MPSSDTSATHTAHTCGFLPHRQDHATFLHHRQIMVPPPVFLLVRVRRRSSTPTAHNRYTTSHRLLAASTSGFSDLFLHARTQLLPCFCDWLLRYSVNVHNPSHYLSSLSVNVNRGRRNKGHRPALRALAGLGFRAPVPPAPLGARVPRDHDTLSPQLVHRDVFFW